MDRADIVQDDVVVGETAAGLRPVQEDQLVLYAVSLFGVANVHGELLNGDALLVRPRGTSDFVMLSALLGCAIEQLPELLASSGTWSVREVTEIDGHRMRFEPN